jgi:hypothetical protein
LLHPWRSGQTTLVYWYQYTTLSCTWAIGNGRSSDSSPQRTSLQNTWLVHSHWDLVRAGFILGSISTRYGDLDAVFAHPSWFEFYQMDTPQAPSYYAST